MVQGRLDNGVQGIGTLLEEHLGGGHIFGCCPDQIQFMHGLSLSSDSTFVS